MEHYVWATRRHTTQHQSGVPSVTPPHTDPQMGQGHPHVLGLDAGLLGTDMAIVLITFMVPLTLLQLPKG